MRPGCIPAGQNRAGAIGYPAVTGKNVRPTWLQAGASPASSLRLMGGSLPMGRPM